MTVRKNHTGEDSTSQPKFYNVFIPLCIARLVYEKEITCADAYLLGIINSMVDPEGFGCYATNTYLSRYTGINVRQLQYRLSWLFDMGYLIRSKVPVIRDGAPIRTMETPWSRPKARSKKRKKQP